MNIITVKTRPLLPPKDDIYPILDEYLPTLHDNDIICITSKILAIHQGRCVPMKDVVNKDDLIIQESEKYIDRSEVPHEYTLLTIKDHTLIASAGIDESNSNGYYVLWPDQTNTLIEEIRSYLLKKHTLKNLGVIATDSHTIPLRYGVVGISTGYAGLKPLNDYRGKPDIFGRELKMTQTNTVDALSAIAVMYMGEGAEQTPIAILRDMENIQFTDEIATEDFFIPLEEDIYLPLLKVFKDKKQI